ncbi:AbfB domain-containing protein [Amycolatopsis thailandensis]|uniref:AbfB domain-containing protein n=1 Tax=Amycolatopsis thailandensis TaxID=589330 RepID=UPI0037BA2918
MAVAAVAAMFAGLPGAPAGAAETPPGQGVPPAVPTAEPDIGATTVPPASQRDKVLAVEAIEVGEATDDWLRLSDKNFVFKIYEKISVDNYPRTKAEASRIYGLAVADASAFIRTGVHEFVQRDHDEKILRDNERRDRIGVRMKALENARIIPLDPVLLDLTDRNFVFQVASRAKSGSRVQNGAMAAYKGDAAAWKTFIEVTVLELAEQDIVEHLDRLRRENAEKAAREERDIKRRTAVAEIPATFQNVWLDAEDDVFIRELLRLPELANPANIEVKDATERASRSTDREVWKAFVETGLKAAAGRDKARREAQEDQANRDAVRQLKVRAENSGLLPRLVTAATTALAGDRNAVITFLRTGQYEVLTQSFGTYTPGVRGWHVQGGGGDAWITPGNAGTDGTKPLAFATWKVAAGLADPLCYSLESTERAGNYLRQQDLRVKLHGNDGTDQFKKDATWCPQRNGATVLLESKAQPGRILRHIDAQLWIAQLGGGNWFDTDRLFHEDSNWRTVAPNPEVSTPLMLDWFNDDSLRALAGNPKAAEIHDAGARFREFTNGRLYWSQQTGAKFITGEILTRYLGLGGHKWLMPSTNQVSGPTRAMVNFNGENLAIYWSPSTGAKYVMGSIRDRWNSLGAEAGRLGFPTSDEFTIAPGRQSNFEHGYITWNSATYEIIVHLAVSGT